ncbi:hypothetical protein [Gemmobacter sp. 24YEA27]|uniref:hypothetical protein n=1 Tax=Gemmobacter sp. 24YEA27 TaxID=3040672 RepID=UPI0024B3C2F9|nr:hypothetical protein [Gemmobacter sp. 24YEA27]
MDKALRVIEVACELTATRGAAVFIIMGVAETIASTLLGRAYPAQGFLEAAGYSGADPANAGLALQLAMAPERR